MAGQVCISVCMYLYNEIWRDSVLLIDSPGKYLLVNYLVRSKDMSSPSALRSEVVASDQPTI